MHFSGLYPNVRLLAAVGLAAVLISGCRGQNILRQSQASAPSPNSSVLKDYSQPYTHHPNPIAPYESHHVDPPNLTNAPRLEALIKDGKLELSMDDAIALTLENNLDLAIARAITMPVRTPTSFARRAALRPWG